jgi:hypothetical protein
LPQSASKLNVASVSATPEMLTMSTAASSLARGSSRRSSAARRGPACRVRAEPVVDRPRVVAVVDVDVEAREVHLEPIARRPVELAASRELIARIGVVAAEEHVVTEAVALVLVQRSAIAERIANGPPMAAP